MMEKLLNKYGLVIEPHMIEFMDDFPGKDSSQNKVTFYNRGKRKIILKILKPYSWVFQVDNNGKPIFLSPGLSVTITINYKYAHEFARESNLPFVIDNQFYCDIPIRVREGMSILSVTPLHINFGIIDLGSQFVAQYLTLSNSGSITAKFAIDFGSNKLDLLATPKHGSIAPYGVQLVKVEMAGFTVGELFDEFWVKGEPPSRIEVEVHVLFPYFQTIHPNTTGDFTLINFKPTYFGTERYETFIVQNVSSFPSCFVVLAEMNGQLVTLNKAEESVYNNFSIHPIEGKLGPFEGGIFTIKFHPQHNSTNGKGWKHLKVDELEFLCFLRVLRVDVVEWQEDDSRDLFVTGLGRTTSAVGTFSESNHATDMLRICLHGGGVKPILSSVPDFLCFKDVEVGKDYRKVLRLSNGSSSLPLGYHFKKEPGFYVLPETNFIEPKKSLEITVTFRVTSLAFHKKHLTFEVVFHNDATDHKNLQVIAELQVGLSITIKSTAIIPQPKFNLGITPSIAHETGVHTEEIKYKEIHKKRPKMMLIPKKEFEKRPWLKSEALVAFPNDMPKSLRVKEHDPRVRAIFTGKKRYIPPADKSFAFSSKENQLIQKQNEKLRKFYHIKAKKIRRAMILDKTVALGNKSYSDERLEKLMNQKDAADISYDYRIKKKYLSEQVSLNEICPLTPTHLYNIRVMPKTLDFGKIPPNVDCVKIIRIDNFNNFSVTIKLLLHKAKMNEQVFVVAPRSRSEKEITLNLKSYGKYYSNVSYVVNNSHSFDLKLSADVVQRTLSVMSTELTINLGKNQFEDIFQIKWAVINVFNPLYVPTSYSWNVPLGMPFTLEPMEGKVPGNKSIACVVYFDLRKKTGWGGTVHLNVNDGQQIPIRITLLEDQVHNVSTMLSKRILPPISLNLSFIETVLLFNAGFKDVIYSVVTPHPLEGVTVRPVVGVIPARTCVGINMDFRMTCVAAFDFHLLLEIQSYHIIETRFIGHVVFPKVEFNPNMMVLRSTPCCSRDCYPLQVENQSSAVAQIQFSMDNYPQIKLSSSKNHKLPGIDEDGLILQPKLSKDIYLHFMPNDLASYEFYLPVIINKIIGPPILHIEDTLKPETYISINRENNKLRKYFDLDCPSKVTSVHVDCSVARGYLEFSKQHLTFNLLERNEVETKSIYIKNITKEVVSVWFDTNVLLSTPFTMIAGPSDRYQTMHLKPNESTAVTITFEPTFPNVFECDLPLYVKEYNESVPYTIFSIKGTLPISVLYCTTSLIHFLPVPINCCIERAVEIIGTHQYREAKVSCSMRKIMGEYQGEDVFDFFYPKGNKIPKNHEPFSLPVVIRFKAKRMLSFSGSIVISDEQDGQCLIQFTACADNAVMSNHIYLFLRNCSNNIIKDKSVTSTDKTSEIRIDKIDFSDLKPEVLEQILDFPKFPKRSSNSSYACYMRRILQTMEQWLFEQGFNGSYRMIIGEHVAFTKAYITAMHSQSKSANYDCVRSIIDLLFNFVGHELFLQYQLPTTVPEDDSGRIGYSLNIYKQVLQFIKVQGGNVSHIFPIYLLAYDDYIYYYNEVKMRHIERSKNGMHFQDIFDEKCTTQIFLPKEEFESYCLQSWMDIIMQVHKTIIQGGLPYSPELKMCMKDSNLANRGSSAISDSYEIHLIEAMTHLKKLTMDRPDRTLIAWLSLVYNGMKYSEDRKKLPWPIKYLSNLHDDLMDGVILGAVTLFYCPYLEELYFQDFYYNPKDETQNHHNGVILATAWNAIRIGITVMPTDFYNKNPVFMMVLVCHLYSVLRTYIPQASIQFLSCLSQSVTRKISIINPNPSSIGYAIKILGDSNGFFSLQKLRPIVVLSARSSVTIPVNFIARTITPVKAILVLSGTCMPNGYANNIVFTLNGEPYKLVVSSDYIISTPIYKPTFINANVISPYKTDGEYEIWYTEEEPRPGRLNIQKWSTIRQHKVPRILYIACNRLFIPPVNSLHPAVLPLTAASYSLNPCTFWIVLRNQEIGDFILKVLIRPRVENPFLIIPVRLPTGKCTGFPNIRCSYNCPRTFYIYIPCRNARLWSSVKSMFSLTLENKEISFWERHLETRIGLDLVRWMLGAQQVSVAREIGYLFNSKVKYNVNSQHKDLEVEPTVVIEDVHSPGYVKLMAHVCCMVQTDSTANITMESECGKEIRYYQVRFTKPLEGVVEDLSLPCRKCIVVPSVPSRSLLRIKSMKSSGQSQKTI